MSAKLRIKAKGIEIEWEGEVDYLKNDLPDLIAKIVSALGNIPPDDEDTDGDEGFTGHGTFTTAALAAKVQPSNGPELFKVALAKLQISDKVDRATRNQIHTEMKSASKFYKPSMLNNLTKAIDTLLKSGAINEPSKGNFALSHDAQEQYLAKLKS